MVTTNNTYITIKQKKHSPVDPSILEPDHRQAPPPPLNNMEGAPGLNDENT
jgi:hypothetical protein